MPQTLVTVGGIGGKADADKLVASGEALDGVKLMNVNTNDGRVVITHDTSFDVEAFKKLAIELGYTV